METWHKEICSTHAEEYDLNICLSKALEAADLLGTTRWTEARIDLDCGITWWI